VVGPSPGLGEVEAPPRSRSSLSSEAKVESEPLGRARRRPSAEARAESEPWGRARRSSSSSGAEPDVTLKNSNFRSSKILQTIRIKKCILNKDFLNFEAVFLKQINSNIKNLLCI
jgi:hypothetical protein